MNRYAHQFGEIVAQRLKALNTNAYAAETSAGLAADAIRNVIRSEKKSGPTLSRVEEICSALGLELYIGPPRDHAPLPELRLEDEDFAKIPLHDALLAAGQGSENLTEEVVDYLAFQREWLRKIGVAPSNAVLARARGDSMQPCIWDGDIVLIDRSRTEIPVRKIGSGRGRSPIFALLDDGQARIKRIERPEEGQVMLLSDNPDHPPQFAKIETLSIIGKVLWWGHTNRE